MKVVIDENIVRIVILDISGIYAKIHNQGYFDKEILEDIKYQYSDNNKWQIIVID